jgi:predicted nucleotidyltransferase
MEHAKLLELLGGKDRLSLLRALFLTPSRRFTNQQLAAETGVHPGNAHKLLARWVAVGLVERAEEGRNITYRAADDPALEGLRELLLRNDVLIADIRAALPAAVETAVVFGSVARGEEKAGSDIDILALGDGLSEIKVNAALRPVGRKHRREISASCFSAQEFERLLVRGDAFARSVVSQRTIPLKGELRFAAESVA